MRREMRTGFQLRQRQLNSACAGVFFGAVKNRRLREPVRCEVVEPRLTVNQVVGDHSGNGFCERQRMQSHRCG